MSDPTPDLEPELSAYDLLSKPTLDLSDKEVGGIVEELRRKRLTQIKTGKPDKPKAEKKAAVKLSADEKQRNTIAFLDSLNLKI